MIPELTTKRPAIKIRIRFFGDKDIIFESKTPHIALNRAKLYLEKLLY